MRYVTRHKEIDGIFFETKTIDDYEICRLSFAYRRIVIERNDEVNIYST